MQGIYQNTLVSLVKAEFLFTFPNIKTYNALNTGRKQLSLKLLCYPSIK